MAQALLLFIKNPERGKVKTRLARTLGDDHALAIYHSLLRNTRRVAQAVEVERLLFYGQFVDHQDDWPETDFQKRVQSDGDLGDRMHQAFVHALTEKGYVRAVLVGSDIAALTPEILREAFDQLAHHEFVLGPARDGGYYLIGMKHPTPSLFREMPWSTPEVGAETRRRMDALGHTPYLLPTLSDVDNEADWLREKGKMRFEK